VDAFDRNMQGRSPQAEVLEPGFKYNLPDMAAVLGIGQLKRLDEFIMKRKAIADLYLEHFKTIDEIMPLSLPAWENRHAWHLFIVRLDTDKAGISRDQFMDELKKRNIGTGLHFRAAHLQKYYRENMGFNRGMLPDTEWNSDRIFSIPLFPDMNEEDVKDVVNTIKDILKR
jgi:UDP-4-amino-4-deoxy-L-arabinose-oxoglutarate aminotransferase